MYKQSIILFGIFLPLLCIGAMVGGCYFIKSKMTASFTEKTDQYKQFSMSQNAAAQMESKIRDQRGHLTRWKKDLSEETTTNIRTNLKLISDKLPSNEFQETGFDPVSGRSGYATASQQKSSQFRMGFRGTFRSGQQALLELETRMPQLMLQELKIDPSSQSSLLNFQVNYTAWEN